MPTLISCEGLLRFIKGFSAELWAYTLDQPVWMSQRLR